MFGVPFRRVTGGPAVAFQRFYAMLVKHAIHSWRNRFFSLAQILIPVVFTVMACGSMAIFVKQIDPPPLLLSLGRFDEPEVPFTAVGPGSVAQQLAVSYSAVADRHGRPVDVGGSNMDDYLLNVADRSLDDYSRRYLVAATVNGTRLVGHFNNFALHGIAISLSLADNAVLHYAVPGSYLMETVNHPLPRSVSTRTSDERQHAVMMAVVFPIMLSLGMAFLIGTFVFFGVKHRANNAKHSQFVSGVDAAGYWLAAFVWDLVSFAVSSALIVAVVLAFRLDSYSEWPVFGCVDTAVIFMVALSHRVDHYSFMLWFLSFCLSFFLA